MKKFSKNLIAIALSIIFIFGFIGLNVVHAATSYTFTSASGYSVVGGAAITNTGATTTTGSVGVSPGTSIGAGITGGAHFTPPASDAAQADNLSAFTALDAGDNADANCTAPYLFGAVRSLNGANLVPGVYCADAFTLSGTLTLNGGAGDVWVFKSASTLITSGTANVVGGDPCNVWWRVGSSVTLGTYTSLIGNILALNGINSMGTGATLNGRLLAQAAGTVTLDTNTITRTCAVSQGTLRVTKIVNNNHGGTLSNTDFSFSVDSGSPYIF